MSAAKFAVTDWGFKPNYMDNILEVFELKNPIAYNIDYNLKFKRINIVEGKEYDPADPLFEGGSN